MLTLTLIFCVTGDVSACPRIKTDGFALPSTCAVAAQREAANWVAEHPHYHTTIARCWRSAR